MASKVVTVTFDDNAQAILKDVDIVHRDSLINVGLALVAKTEYYKTLSGTSDAPLVKVASLSSLDDLEAELEAEAPKETPKPKSSAGSAGGDTNWDNF